MRWRWLQLAAILASVTLPLVLVACGDDESTTTETETGAATDSTETTTEEQIAPTGPSGDLSENGLGAATYRLSQEGVVALFGAPDKEQRFPGCELSGSNRTPVISATWNLADGPVQLSFDAKEDTLSTYRTQSSAIATTEGVRVGDPFSDLQAAYGADLEPLNLGINSTPQLGPWIVYPKAKLSILFNIEGGAVTDITGGDIVICE